MTRHFLVLYFLIVITLVTTSWGQDQLWQAYGPRDVSDDGSLVIAFTAIESQLRAQPKDKWPYVIANIAAGSNANIELLSLADVAGKDTLTRLQHGDIAYMQTEDGESWKLKQINQDYVLAFKSIELMPQRSTLEWSVTLLFYATIALVLMIWLWPLTRDLRRLEAAAAQYGNKQWSFDAKIKTHSLIHRLAEAFRKMAVRIDGLIASHKDMANAISHEIKTPLSRMQFEIELAQQAGSVSEVNASLLNIRSDIAAINDLVTATMEYAILERADITLNIAQHDLTKLIPAILASVQRDVQASTQFEINISTNATCVICDGHLFETMLRNLLYNASRYAKRNIHVTFDLCEGSYRLIVEDDGPGIPEQDLQRVFDSFVQLDQNKRKGKGFGLGLAIVKRALEWHEGKVEASRSSLGGAKILLSWPISVLDD